MSLKLRAYSDKITRAALQHILLNYSETEVGLRHPSLPVGAVFRDQGQADVYAGESRLILSTTGAGTFIAKSLSLVSQKLQILVPEPEELSINGYRLDNRVGRGLSMASVQSPEILDSYHVVEPVSAAKAGVATIPLNQVFQPVSIFSPDPDLQGVEGVDEQIFRYFFRG